MALTRTPGGVCVCGGLRCATAENECSSSVSNVLNSHQLKSCDFNFKSSL